MVGNVMRLTTRGCLFAVLTVLNCFVWLHLAVSNWHTLKQWSIDKLISSYGDSMDESDERLVEEEQRMRQWSITRQCQGGAAAGTSGLSTRDATPHTSRGLNSWKTISVITEPMSRASYCLSRKISSTFWLQVLTYLDETRFPNSQNIPTRDLTQFSPFNISKLEVQLQSKLKHRRLDSEAERRTVFNTTRFMFVRDPYSRLWSVYLDKFVIMDSWFFSRFGTVILKRKGVVVRDKTDVCNTDYQISFQDFLDFVIFWNNKTNGQMDDHFGTILNHCNPCMYKPHFVGKLDTFQRDSQHVLKLLQFEKFGEMLKTIDHSLNEIQMLVTYNYHMFNQKYKNCHTWCIARLLDAFKMNGYLSYKSVEKVKGMLPLSKKALADAVTSEYKNSNFSSQDAAFIKRKWKIKFYRKVRRKTLFAIEKIYENEMIMFDYDLYPNEIFQTNET